MSSIQGLYTYSIAAQAVSQEWLGKGGQGIQTIWNAETGTSKCTKVCGHMGSGYKTFCKLYVYIIRYSYNSYINTQNIALWGICD